MGMFPTPKETLELFRLDQPDKNLLPNQRALKGFMQDWYAIAAGTNIIVSKAVKAGDHYQADPVGVVEIGQLNWGFRPEQPDRIHLSYIQATEKRKGTGSAIL